MVYAGLDIGTTGVKITVFSSCLELGRFYEKYDSKRDAEHDEIDASLIWKASFKVIKEACEAYPKLQAIGVTSFGETFVLLDENDEILLPSILYNDVRGKEEVPYIASKVPPERLGEITGLMNHEMFSLAKLLYVKRTLPEIYRKVSKVLLIQDYIVYMLTGVRKIDYSLASRTSLFDVKKKKWSEELFSAFGLEQSMFSDPVPSGSVAGTAKKNLGLGESIRIIPVSHDQVSVALGCGLSKEGEGVDGCGTCECVIPFVKEAKDPSLFYKNGFGLVPYEPWGAYLSYPLIFSGGALVEWFVNAFGEGKENPYAYFEERIDTNGPTSLLLAPHFLGSGTPFMNSKGKGFVYGLDISTSVFDLYKAVLEGVAYEIRLNLETLEEGGVKINRLLACGGGSKNAKWLQIKADVLGLPITRIANPNSGTVGSAIVVGKTIGEFTSLEEGIAKLVKQGETYYPREAIHTAYSKNYERYKRLVKSMNEEER